MTKTYAQIAREIENLTATAEKLLAIEIKGAIAKINQVIARYRLAAGDLSFGPDAASAPSKPSVAKSAKGKRSAKGSAKTSVKVEIGRASCRERV